MFYQPFAGGQQAYIHSLNKILESENIEWSVFQQKQIGYQQKHENVTMLPYSQYLGYLLYPIKDVAWFGFNAELMLHQKKIMSNDVLICHYPFHYPAIKKHPNAIVLSHGVDWQDKFLTLADKYRIKTANMCKKDKVTIVSNDTNFLRVIGFEATPGKGLFEEIEKNIWCIPNCIDTGKFKRIEEIAKESLIIVPRNIRRQRGIHLALEAFVLFAKRHKYYKMLITGGPLCGEYYEECKKIVLNAKLQDRVIFEGFVNPENMPLYYNRAMFSIIPTTQTEGTSLSALESMSCGTPVISTKVGGLADLPTLHSEVNSKDLYEKMCELHKNISFYSESQKNATIDVFNLKNWREAWMSVIKSKVT